MPVRVAANLVREKSLVVPPDISPVAEGEEAVEFVVRYADNRAVLARQNFFDEVRYVQRTDSGEQETIRSFPMGELKIATILLVLRSWNIRTDPKAPPAPITEKSIQDLLTPEEFQWLYDQIIDMNPVWSGRTDEGED